MRSKRLVSMDEAVQGMFARYPRKARLGRLWQNWSMVMGADIAPLACPLGEHKGVLLVGGEDSMIMQELSLLRDEMLERANAFMDEPFFSSVHVALLLGKRPLDALAALPSRRSTERVLPCLDGSALTGRDSDTPVARCYAAFVALARSGEKNKG